MSYIAEGDGPDLHPDEACNHIPPTPVVFHGEPGVFFLAICRECNEGHRPVPMPFGTEDARALWVAGHRSGAGHHVALALEVRP